MVRRPSEAILDTTTHRVSDRLADPIFYDGNRRLAVLGGTCLEPTYDGTRAIRRSACTQCRVVADFLWLAWNSQRTDSHHSAGCGLGRDNHRGLSGGQDRSHPSPALHRLDSVRDGPQRPNMDIELKGAGLFPATVA